MNTIFIPYDEAYYKLKEADILLFRHRPFPTFSWWIAKYSQSPYSHVGLAHLNSDWCCLEFREFIGSRCQPLREYVQENNAQIDVFRVAQHVGIPHTNNISPKFQSIQNIEFTEDISKSITKAGLDLLGRSYGWGNIWRIALTYTPFIRLWEDKTDNHLIDRCFVCSTLASYLYRIYYRDLCPFIGDNYVSPADIARSALLEYQFTLI